MKRISLSERFGRVKAVVPDSTESETDISDNDLFPKVPTECFKFSNHAATITFSGYLEQTAENEQNDIDSDTDFFEMEPEWTVLFQKILKKSRKLSGTQSQEKCTSLFDKAAQQDRSSPLLCLQNTLDQYNRLSQSSGSNSLNDDLITDEITIERNETELDICDDFADEIGDSEDADTLYKNVEDVTEFVENTDKEQSGETVLKGLALWKTEEKEKINCKGDATDKAGSEIASDKERIEATSVRYKSCAETPNQHNPDPSISIKENSDKEFSLQQACFEENDASLPLKSVNSSQKRKPLELNLENENAHENLKNVLFKHDKKSSKNSKKSDKMEEKLGTSEKNKSSENVKDIIAVKSNKSSCLFENKNEKVENRWKATEKSGSEKDNTNTVANQSKNLSKVKKFEIKPSVSFPLDELLPLATETPEKNRKPYEETSENIGIQRKRHSSKTFENMDSDSVERGFNPVPPQLLFEQSVFHGTVYESPTKETLSDKTLEESHQMAMPCGTQTSSISDELDIVTTNLLAALQSGNQNVISMFQTALHNQIGSNLEALALKARQNYSNTPIEPKTLTSFGFYKERTETSRHEAGVLGENETSQKYDELLCQLIEECSALVKTEEDMFKLKSLLKVLKNEEEKNFTGTGFTPPHEAITNLICDLNDKQESIHHETVSEENICVGSETDHLAELFEGRTLLKGGVKPRHIPKTTVHKPGQDDPKDPRFYSVNQKDKTPLKFPMPEFAVELYGEKKTKQILHLDWSMVKSVSVSEKDPRVQKAAVIDSNSKLIVDATKSLLEHLNTSQRNKASGWEENSKISVQDSADVTHKTAPISDLDSNDAQSVGKQDPVVIAEPEQAVHENACTNSDRNAVLSDIYTAKLSVNDFVSQDKKACIGIVKPLVEISSSLKETKPSVGIVKPIQVHTSKTPVIKSKEKDRISPSGTNRLSVSMELDSDMEDRDVGTLEEVQLQDKDKNKSEGDGFIEKVTNKRTSDRKGKRQTYLHEKVTDLNEVIIVSSDLSCSEDGQINTDSEREFTVKIPVMKKEKRGVFRSRERSGRNYRKRERSTSISSVDSRFSYSSKGERRPYISDSSNKFSSLYKSDQRERSRSRDKDRVRSPMGDPRSSHYRHRQRRHTTRDDRTCRDLADRCGAVKRHHNTEDSRRKRHRTEESRTSTASDFGLSDEEISEEYHARFGKNKTGVSRSSAIGYSHTSTSAEYDNESEKSRKPRRKSLEEQQKEVQEDRKFLEYCKSKFLGKPEGVTSKSAPLQRNNFVVSTKRESACRTKPAESMGLSYSDMLHLADLEEGEI